MSILLTKYAPLDCPMMNVGASSITQLNGVTQVTVFEGVEGQQFNFATFVALFKGKLVYLWAADDANAEDAAGQWIRFSTLDPNTLEVLSTGTVVPQDTSTWRTACGLWVRGDELYALTRRDNTVWYHLYNPRTNSWKEKGILFSGYLINEPPIFHKDQWNCVLRNAGGVFIATGDIDKWSITLVPNTSGISAIEPSLISHRGELNLVMRNNGGSYLYRHYAGETDTGTNYLDSRSKCHRLKLPDGRIVMFNNANRYASSSDRKTLHVGVSLDGLVYHKVSIVHSDPPPVQWGALASRNGWNYPNSCLCGDAVLVASALNKQSAVLTRIPISVL